LIFCPPSPEKNEKGSHQNQDVPIKLAPRPTQHISIAISLADIHSCEIRLSNMEKSRSIT